MPAVLSLATRRSRRSLRLLVALCATASLGAVGAAPRALAATETATSGAVTAKLTYRRAGGISFTGLRVRIERAGAVLVDENPGRGPTRRSGPAGFGRERSVAVRDLDADGEPEVIVKLYTGGAHCCFVGVIYHLPAAVGAYARTARNFLDTGYRLTDLGGAPGPEFVSADAAFAFAFSSFAESRFPISIFRFRDGALRDVTGSFPGRIRSDIRRQRREYTRLRRGGNPRGALAALVADLRLLGRPAAGERVLRSALRRGDLARSGRFDTPPYGRDYIRALHRLLRRLGYSR